MIFITISFQTNNKHLGCFFSFFYLSVDDGREAEIVEDLCAVPPHGDGAELAEALVVKAVDLRDLARLVVAPDERDAVRVAHLERQQKQEGLDAVESPVDKVAHEEVVRVGHVAAHFEQLFEVVELSVNVSAYLEGGAWTYLQREGAAPATYAKFTKI